ncbi:uncharacterized protein LOC132760376 isoform X2 [Ruditapes philippinarum]|uniref:uncharacterized protein LOC132760376 isoform X2 n=1 Tax=Ruditapes philippinarum TaxID=129788 RepID=UPI00295B3D50|nr:uncharacterized protein LOC132760376 isoform X2 [Ruditapes philippinarum]
MGKRDSYSDGNSRNAAHGRNKSNATYDNRGYQGEPAEQRISARQAYQAQLQGEFHGNVHPSGSQTSFEMQPMGQPYPMGPQNVQYAIPIQGYLPPVNAQNVQYAQPSFSVQVLPPGNQYMVRDSSSPLPPQTDDLRTYMPSIVCIIFKRIISTLFILFDLCLTWSQFAAWVGHFDLPDWMNVFENVNSLKSNSRFQSNCSVGSSDLTTYYGIIAGIGTVYAILKIVNMIGETILEYQKQNPSETEAGCRGFQFIHGWIETLLGLVCDDLPQIIFLVVFSASCDFDYIAVIKVFIWGEIKSMKNNYRVTSCKQKYKPCCYYVCKDCCVYYYDFTCCCHTLIFRPCACCGSDQCVECETFEICPDCPCNRQTGCCGEIENDPQWALRLYRKAEEIYEMVLVLLLILMFVELFKNWNVSWPI